MDAFLPLMETQAKAAKRKSDASTRDADDEYVDVAKPTAKKPRTSKAGGSKSKADPHANAKQLVEAIIASPQGFALPADENATRLCLVNLANYAAALAKGDAAGSEGTRIIKAKSEEQIEALAEKLRKTILAGIRKQMTWKASCKHGSAMWSYQGVATDPAVFQSVMLLDAPANFKQTKIPVDTLYEMLEVRTIQTSVRYDYLVITSPEINIKWNKDTTEFKISGTYGKA